MVALRQRFSGGGEPLHTCHHAIADGLSAMALLQRLFILLAALASGSAAPPQTNWDAVTPDLSQSFRGLRPGPLALSELLERRDLGLSTSYGLEQLSASASRALLA